MRQDLAEIKERRISSERSANFRGTALVRLEVLKFVVKNSRDADYRDKEKRADFKNNVKRLKGIFKDGCYQLDPENRISAIIDQQSLDDAIQASPAETTLETLLKNPCGEPPVLIFPPNYRLKCLAGQSRVQAAKEVLSPEKQFWAVELYLEDAPHELQTSLAEQYPNSANLLPGEIYYNIRHYYKDELAEAQWLARLTRSQKDVVTKFVKQKSSWLTAFNRLHVFRGQWFGFRPSMLPEIMAMKCDEENLYYLEHIRTVWSSILHEDRKLISLTDSNTVKELQLRVPGLCADDAEFVKSMMNDGVLFPRIESPEERQRILYDLLQIKTPIPTIATYFEDIKVLLQYKKIMKLLLGDKIKDTIRKTLQDSFTGVNQKEGEVRVQETESSFRSYPGNLTDQINLGIIQLGQYAFRNFTELIPECPRKEEGEDTPVPKSPKASVWQAFATLAYDLGFECEEIHRLRSINPDREIAHAALLQARDPEHFEYEDNEFESFQDQMVDMFERAFKLPSRPTSPTFFVDDSGESLQRRCGRPFTNAYASYRQSFFLKALTVSDHVGGKGITPIFVQVSIYRAFFGELIPSALPNPLGPPLDSENHAFPLQRDVQMSTSSMTSEQRNRLEEERDRLRSELRKAADDQSKLKQDLEEQKVDMDRTVRELKEELRSRVVGQEELQMEVERLRGDYARVRAEHDEHQDSAEKDIQGLTEEIVALRIQREVDEKALQSALIENQELSAAHAELEQNLQRLEAAASETTQSNALNEALIEKQKLAVSNEELCKEIQKLSIEKDEVQQNLERSIATQSDAIKELSASNEEFRQEILQLSIQKDEFQQNLERSKATQSDALKESLTEKEKLCRQKEELTKKNGELQKDFERFQIRHELLAKLKSEADDLRAEVVLLRDNKVEMEQNLVKLDTTELEKRELRHRVVTLEATLSEKHHTIEELESKRKALEETKISLQAEIDSLESSLANLREETTWKIKETNRVTQEQLKRAAKEQEHVKHKLNLKITERNVLQESLTVKEKELASLREQTNWLILSSTIDQKVVIPVRDVETMGSNTHVINFKLVRNGHAETVQSLPMSAAELERIGKKSIRKGTRLYTTDYRGLLPEMAFDAVVGDGTYTILLVPEGENFEVCEEVLASDLMLDTRKLKKPRKRRKF